MAWELGSSHGAGQGCGWSLTQFWLVRYEERFAGGEGNLGSKSSCHSAFGENFLAFL